MAVPADVAVYVSFLSGGESPEESGATIEGRLDPPVALGRDEASGSIPRTTIVRLLIEDENAVRKFAATVLRGGGFEVTEARTGPDALAL